jgi:hypothetical protein
MERKTAHSSGSASHIPRLVVQGSGLWKNAFEIVGHVPTHMIEKLRSGATGARQVLAALEHCPPKLEVCFRGVVSLGHVRKLPRVASSSSSLAGAGVEAEAEATEEWVSSGTAWVIAENRVVALTSSVRAILDGGRAIQVLDWSSAAILTPAVIYKSYPSSRFTNTTTHTASRLVLLEFEGAAFTKDRILQWWKSDVPCGIVPSLCSSTSPTAVLSLSSASPTLVSETSTSPTSVLVSETSILLQVSLPLATLSSVSSSEKTVSVNNVDRPQKLCHGMMTSAPPSSFDPYIRLTNAFHCIGFYSGASSLSPAVWSCAVSGVDQNDNILLCGSSGPLWTPGLLGAPIVDSDGCVHGVITSLHGDDRLHPTDGDFWFALPNRGDHSRVPFVISHEAPRTVKRASFATVSLADQLRRLLWRP